MKNDGGASFSLQRRLQPADFGMFLNGAVLAFPLRHIPLRQRLVAALRKGSLSAEGRFVRSARVALRQFVTLSSSQNVRVVQEKDFLYW
jgi:hypothetical protein